MNKEYRKGVNEVARETAFTFRTILKWGLPILLVLIVIGFGLQALGIISIDIQREIRQHSQPYVETKISLLHKLHNDWLQLDTEIAELGVGDGNEEIISAKTAQQKNIVKRAHSEAELIPSSQVQESIKAFLSSHRS